MPVVHPPVETEPLVTVEAAQAIVMAAIKLLRTERVAISSALGRVLAEPVAPRVDLPPHDNSSVDGYAVRAEDTTIGPPCVLDVIEEIPAGRIPQLTVEQGQAARIMTGAVLPVGADAVVMQENTSTTATSVQVHKAVSKGQNVRYRGEDVRAGQVVLLPGTALGPGEIGLLASFQKSVVTVTQAPTVAILSTGDEIVDIDEPLLQGKIVNSNSYSLSALVREAGGRPTLLGIVRDTEREIREAIQEALHADFVLSTGGVSVGDYDFVKSALVELGADMRLWRVLMKPGKPLAFGTVQDKPYFGLPGNPVSCMVSFLLFVRPALRKAMGYPASTWYLPTITAILSHSIRSGGDRRHYLRAHVTYRDGQFWATTVASQGSGILSSMAGTNGLVIVETGINSLPEQSSVQVMLMRPFLTSDQ